VNNTGTGGVNSPGFELYNEGVWNGGLFYREAENVVSIFTSLSSTAPAFAITSSNNYVGFGTYTPTYKIESSGNSLATSAICTTRYSSDNASPSIILRKSRGTESSKTSISNGDYTGLLVSQGYDGSAFANSSEITFQASENWTGSAHGCEIFFYTTDNTTTTQDIRLKISHNGTFVFYDNILQQSVLKDYGETVNVLGDLGGGTDNINLESGNVVTATVSTSTQTFTFSNPSVSGVACSFTLILTNGGSQTVNWPASVDWAGGTPPSLTASGVDVLRFTTVDGGTTWYGFVLGIDMK